MLRRTSLGIMLVAAIGCAASSSGTGLDGSSSKPASVDAFAGAWRSVTPSLEFIRLSIDSKSSEFGVLGARLTLSGVAWEGSGRIEGDSLIVNVATPGAPSSGTLVAHARDAQTLTVQLRHSGSAPVELTLVREP